MIRCRDHPFSRVHEVRSGETVVDEGRMGMAS